MPIWSSAKSTNKVRSAAYNTVCNVQLGWEPKHACFWIAPLKFIYIICRTFHFWNMPLFDIVFAWTNWLRAVTAAFTRTDDTVLGLFIFRAFHVTHAASCWWHVMELAMPAEHTHQWNIMRACMPSIRNFLYRLLSRSALMQASEMNTFVVPACHLLSHTIRTHLQCLWCRSRNRHLITSVLQQHSKSMAMTTADLWSSYS